MNYLCVCVRLSMWMYVLVHVHMYAHRDQRSVLGVIPQLPPALFSSETGSLIDLELAKWFSLARL